MYVCSLPGTAGDEGVTKVVFSALDHPIRFPSAVLDSVNGVRR